MKESTVTIFLLLCPFYVLAHHKFRCGRGYGLKMCDTKTEVCVQGECVPTCENDSNCPEGEICDEKDKVTLLLTIFTTLKVALE